MVLKPTIKRFGSSEIWSIKQNSYIIRYRGTEGNEVKAMPQRCRRNKEQRRYGVVYRFLITLLG